MLLLTGLVLCMQMLPVKLICAVAVGAGAVNADDTCAVDMCCC